MLAYSSSEVFIITSNRDGIQQLVPLPFVQQAQALAELQQFPEALTMAGLMPEDQVSICSHVFTSHAVTLLSVGL